MKQNNNNRRARGRGPRKPHGMGGGHNKGQGYDGGGQELRVRGNAYQVLEKYLQLARDAGAAGDRIAAENFLQHADHYYRVLAAMNDGQRPRIGGRELSVADVNVQNVSQGLSAALYTSGGGNPQGIPDADLDMGQGGNHQGGSRQGGGGNPGNQQGGQHHQQQGQHQGHQQRGDQQHHQRHEGRGDRPGNQPGNQSGNPSGNQQLQPEAAPTNGHGGYEHAERPAQPAQYAQPAEPVRAVPAPAPVSEDQPDYPDELLSAPSLEVPTSAGDAADEGLQRTLRAPRNRMRGPRRGPRQGGGQGGAQGQGEARPGDQGSADPTE